MQDLKIVVVGAGARGMLFIKLLCDLGHRTATIVENNPDAHEMAAVRARELGFNEIAVFASLNDALLSLRPEAEKAVFIMTPEYNHLELYMTAIANKCHVFMEKPLAADKEDVLRILEISKKSGTITQVGFVLRYCELYQKIKSVVESGRLGQIVTIQMNERLAHFHGANYRRNWRRLKKYTGGFINEKCSHDLDLMCWLKASQGRPSEIISRAGSRLFDFQEGAENCEKCTDAECPYQPHKYAGLNMLDGKVFRDSTYASASTCVFRSDADIYNHQSLLINFTDGTQGVFTAIASTGNKGRDIALFGTRGCIWGSLEKGELTLKEYWGDRTENFQFGTLNPHGNADPLIINSFMECIASSTQPLATVKEGALASILAFAADESAATGKPIVIPEI